MTKLHVPHLKTRLVSRPRLTERVVSTQESKITLISAPAGFGKTTLLSEWIAENHHPVLWISLDEGDNDPARFWSYFISALQAYQPGLGKNCIPLLQSPQLPPLNLIVTNLLNDLSALEDQFSLVLDDFQVIKNPVLHKSIQFLIEHLPPQLYLIISSRTDPPLPLARLRVQSLLTEIRANDLRFTEQEARQFLNQAMELELSDDEIEALGARTEGWIAGLQLVALAIGNSLKGPTVRDGTLVAKDQRSVSLFVQTFTGNHRYIMSYLVEEVLNQRPKRTMDFLLQTSILDRLCSPLCDAVTGSQSIDKPETNNSSPSQDILELLEQSNLFLTSLDDEHHWYRYHHLFADVLQARLAHTYPELTPELHLRAAAWYEQNNFLTEAVNHALAARDYPWATRLIEQIAPPTIVSGRIQTALGWFTQLPEDLLHQSPALCVIYSAALMFTNQLEAAEQWIQVGELYAESNYLEDTISNRLIRGKLAMTRATLARISGDLQECIQFSRSALELLPEEETFWRASPSVHTASAYLLDGDVRLPFEKEAAEAMAPAKISGNLFTILRSITNLARLRTVRGQLHQAEETYQLAQSTAPDNLPYLIGGAAYFIGLGCLQYEWNQLPAASQNLTQGANQIMGTMMVDADIVSWGYIGMARCQQAQADPLAARKTMETLFSLEDQRNFTPQLRARDRAALARLDLMSANLASAVEWAASSGLNPQDAGQDYFRESEYLTLARVWIARGQRDPHSPYSMDAIQLLSKLRQIAVLNERMGSEIEILCLTALAWQAKQDQANAQVAIRQALQLGRPEGYLRTFLDEGNSMRRLLSEWSRQVSNSEQAEYIGQILSAFSVPFSQNAGADSSPGQEDRYHKEINPHAGLSVRELEVLRLIAEGASNQEISAVLVIAHSTVKRHTSNIFYKLGVRSRTQAVAQARTKHLL